MNLIFQIEIENYKSFTHEIIKLDGVTCIVGANESGKSNLLNAIYHLSHSKQSEPFAPDELRMGSPNYPNGISKIRYSLVLNETLLGKYNKIFSFALGKKCFITKSGSPGKFPDWDCAVNISQSAVPEFIRINNKTKYKKEFQRTYTERKLARERSETGWFVKDSSIDLRKQPYKSLIEDEVVELITGSRKVISFGNILGPIVLENIKIFQWTYHEKDFLPEIVRIYDFLKKPDSFPTVMSMLNIAGWKREEFSSKLQNQDDTIYGVLFDNVERKINSLIRNNWSTHKKLTLELQHKGEYFTIHLKQPGSRTPPEYRSDGLKWYLTFLINFRAQSRSIKNYILLIDEPGLHLHPRGQKDTLQELKTLNEKHKNQIIYSTHQTFLINKNKPESVRIIERKLDKTGSRAKNPFFASKVSEILNLKENILTDKLLREALGFSVSDISPINEKNILVEGVFDREVLQIINRIYRVVDLNDTSIIACGGAPNIARHTSLYKANGLKIVCLYDSDHSGQTAMKNNKDAKTKEKRHITQYTDNHRSETMEDLIPDKIFILAYNRWLKEWSLDGEQPQKPRMKDLYKLMQNMEKPKKIEMKHSLENFLIQAIKQSISSERDSFCIIKKILQDLASKLAKRN